MNSETAQEKPRIPYLNKWIEDLRTTDAPQIRGQLFATVYKMPKPNECTRDEVNAKASMNTEKVLGYCALGRYEAVVNNPNMGAATLLPGKIRDHVVLMNDGMRLSFSKIADWLEANYQDEA